MAASGVLVAFRPSTYRKGTPRVFTDCGLAGRPFCASCGTYRRKTTGDAQCSQQPITKNDRERPAPTVKRETRDERRFPSDEIRETNDEYPTTE
jgi:hypothetical protein